MDERSRASARSVSFASDSMNSTALLMRRLRGCGEPGRKLGAEALAEVMG